MDEQQLALGVDADHDRVRRERAERLGQSRAAQCSRLVAALERDRAQLPARACAVQISWATRLRADEHEVERDAGDGRQARAASAGETEASVMPCSRETAKAMPAISGHRRARTYSSGSSRVSISSR